MVQHRVAEHEVEALVGERQALGIGRCRGDVEPEALRVAGQRAQHARRDVAAGRPLDHAVLHEVQREVPGTRPDLEAVLEGAGVAAQELADLAQHLMAADLPEVDAPLGVVLAGGDVVIAGVDLADLLGGGRCGHGRRGV